MNTSTQAHPQNDERKPIASVPLRIRLLLVAILLGGLLAVIVPAAANIHGARQELVQQLCQGDPLLSHRVVCSK